MKRCLACYESLTSNSTQEYHEKCSKRVFGTAKAPVLQFTFDQISELAKQNITHRLAIPGVQPKLSLAIEKADVEGIQRLTIVGLWDGIYILKPANPKYPELPENEDATMHIAASCGIRTAIHSLIRFKSGELAYISRRFDRRIDRRKKTVDKLHQEDMCQITGLLTENKYNSSMEKIAKATQQFTTNRGLESLGLFQLTLFSFITGNSDMHLKNFSLIEQTDGTVELTPAYDLLSTKLAVPEDKEEMALPIAGKKSRFTKADFREFADYCQISPKAAENVFTSLERRIPTMIEWIEKSFLSEEMKRRYTNLIYERAARLRLP